MPSRRLTFTRRSGKRSPRARLVRVVGPRAVRSAYVYQEWLFALQDDQVIAAARTRRNPQTAHQSAGVVES